MPKEVLLPELAESIVEGEIVKWLVEEGDYVKKDQPIVEVMTDKVTVELPSPFEGILVKKLVQEGDVVPIHTPIALIAEPGEEGAEVPAPAAAAAAAPQKAAPLEDEDRVLFKPEEGKLEVKSPFKEAAPAGGAPPPAPADAPRAGTNKYGRVLAVPAARKLARELGIAIEEVPGSGPAGRVRVEDVRRWAESRAAAPAGAPAAARAPASFPPPVAYKTPSGYEALEERKPLRGLRRVIAQQMVASHLYTVRTLTVDELDATELVHLRETLKPEAEAAGVKLSYLPFIFKAVVQALKKYPVLNTSLDEEKQEIVFKKYYNLGMAVATEAGLVVPVIKDVDKKTVLELAREARELAEKARAGKLAPEDVTGSTFSITNIGSIGALFSFPIINVPDAAILGVHTIQDRPVVKDGAIVVRKMMYLSLSFDHRLVDGAEAAMFLREIIRLLESPGRLMLEMR